MWNQLLSAALPPLAQDATERVGVQGPDFARYAIVCGVLIAAILGLAWGFRRLVGGSMRGRASRRSLQVLDVLPLGGKQRLAVVRCYDRTFALGLGDKEVTAIAELDPLIGEEARDDATDAAPKRSDDRTFQRALTHVQRALAESRRGVGPARAAKPRAEHRTAVAELLGGVADAKQAPAEREAAAKPTAERRATTKTSARAKPEPAAQRAPTTKQQPEAAAPARRATPRAEPPVSNARPSLGLEGVMG